MDCEKVRDRFSSFWEKELIPSEEKTIREHLSSCQECQKELERFGKQWDGLVLLERWRFQRDFSPNSTER
jgi:predicted anti-sigma-YlaC factor YlaD